MKKYFLKKDCDKRVSDTEYFVLNLMMMKKNMWKIIKKIAMWKLKNISERKKIIEGSDVKERKVLYNFLFNYRYKEINKNNLISNKVFWRK